LFQVRSGARVTDSPLLPLDSLQVLAGISNAAVREHIAAIAAQRARVRSARIATRPDFDVSLQYGQRSGYTDMVTATVAIPIPLQRGRKQDAEVDVAAAQLDALEAEHHAMLDQLGSELAREYGDAEGARSRLALESLAVLPRARAALSAALSAYQVGRTPFATVVDAQQTVLDGEISYERALADFAKAIAALEETTGTQVLRQEQTR